MKQTKLFLPFVPIAISLFLPMLTFALYCIGYTVSLFNYTLCSLIYTLFFVALCHVILKKATFCKALAFLPFFSLLNLAVYVFKSKSVVAFICMSICFVYSAVIAEKACNSTKAKIASVLTHTVLFVPFLIVSLTFLTLGNFGVNSVIDRIYSPDKTYYAEIVDIDQGALGGETVVYAHRSNKLNLLILTVSKTPQRLYVGEWKEYETMQVKWEDENCLLINSEEHHIDI